MPVAYRKAPRQLVVAPVDDHRTAQPSDNDFTVLLSRRDAPRLAIVPRALPREVPAPLSQPRAEHRSERRPEVRPQPYPAARAQPRTEPRARPRIEPRSQPHVEARAQPRAPARAEPRAQRVEPRFPQPSPRVDADRTAPPTSLSVSPPPPTAVTVAPPPPVIPLRRAPRRSLRSLFAGAAIVLVFGCIAGMGGERMLRGRMAWIPALAAASVSVAPARAADPVAPPSPASSAVLVTAAPPVIAPVVAPAAAPAVADPAKTVRWATDAPLVLPTHDPGAPHRAHHAHRHHHAAPAQAVAARVSAPASPPSPTTTEASSPPHESSDPPVASAPLPAGGAAPDEMAAAVQTLTQAKAEESL